MELQKTLSQPSFQQSSEATAPDRTLGDAVTLIGGAVADAVVQHRAGVIGAAFEEANQRVKEQEDEFNERNRSILAGLTSERDRGRISQYMNEYDKLHAGEVQGTLSPMEASVRRENLYRKFSTTYPTLKKPLLEVTKQFEPNAKLGASDDPVAKARAQLIEKSVVTGVPVPVLVDIEQAKIQHQLALDRGVENFGQMQVVWDTTTVTAVADLQLQMSEEINKNGGLDAAAWKRKLVLTQEGLKRDLNIWSVETSRNGGFTMSREDINSLQTDVDNTFKALTAAVESSDVEVILSRGIKIQQDKGIMAYVKNFGSIGALLPMMGDHAFEFFNQQVPDMLDGIRKHGNFKLIQAAAAAGDKDALMFTSMLDSGAFEGGKYIEAFIASLKNGKTLSNNPHEQAMFDSLSNTVVETFGIGSMSADEVDKKAVVDGAVATMFRPSMPTPNIENAARSPKWRQLFRNDEQTKETYNQFMARSLPELRNKLDVLRDARWNLTFQPVPDFRSGNPRYFSFGQAPSKMTLGEFGSSLMASHVDLTKRLNAMYDIARLTMGEDKARKLAAEIVGGVNSSGEEPVEITEVPDNVTVESADSILNSIGE